MNTDQDLREIGRRFREELWNTGDLGIAAEVVHPECLIHARIPFHTDFVRGPEALGQLVLFYHLAFSEVRVTADQIIVEKNTEEKAEGNTVVVRWTARGRNTGDLLGLPPTGRVAVTSGVDVLRIADGKIVEGWVSWDTLSLLEDLVAPEAREGETGAAPPGPSFLPLLARLWPKK
jgi:predicted ester cyclase